MLTPEIDEHPFNAKTTLKSYYFSVEVLQAQAI
jgi:hypothetical protein